MASNLKKCSVVGVLTATALTGSTAMAQTTTSSGTLGDDFAVQDIIVTAQKREQNVQQVPVSIAVLSDEALQANRVLNVVDLGTVVPNVRITDGVGRGLTPIIDLRGIHTSPSSPGQDSQIPIYLDGAWIPGSQGVSFDLPAVERIEVLRGPQGTLFGRNSTAGAISIVTRDPPGKLGFRSALTIGNYDQVRIATQFDTPEFGGFSATISYVHNERRGDIKNLGAGQRWDRTASPISGQGISFSPKYLGNKNVESVFAALRYEPSDTFKAVYKFDWLENHYTLPGYGAVNFTPENSGATGARLAVLYTANPFPIAGDERPEAVNSGFSTPGVQRAHGHNLTAMFKPSPQISLKNIFAARGLSVSNNNAGFGLGGLLGKADVLGADGQPFEIFAAQTRTKAKYWSDEFQLNYDSNLLTITAGVIYLWVKSDFGGPKGMASSLFLTSVPGGVLPAVPDTTVFGTNKSLAGYGQAEIHLTPQLNIVGGVRVTNDKKHVISNLSTGGRFISDYDKTRASYNAGVDYMIREGLMIYGKFANSFLSGGSFNTIEFKPEIVDSWEAGFKGDFLDKRLRLNVAVWDAKYKNLQISTRGANVGRTDVPLALISLGKLHAKGFEAELTGRPSSALTLSGGIGYTHYKLSDLNPIIGTEANYRLLYRPNWTANGSVQYEIDPGLGNSRLVLRTDASWRSKFRALQSVPVPANYQRFEFVAPELVLNARAGLRNISVKGADLEIAAWVKNLTDSGKPTTPFGQSVTAAPNAYLFEVTGYTPARTFGVDLTVQY